MKATPTLIEDTMAVELNANGYFVESDVLYAGILNETHTRNGIIASIAWNLQSYEGHLAIIDTATRLANEYGKSSPMVKTLRTRIRDACLWAHEENKSSLLGIKKDAILTVLFTKEKSGFTAYIAEARTNKKRAPREKQTRVDWRASLYQILAAQGPEAVLTEVEEWIAKNAI